MEYLIWAGAVILIWWGSVQAFSRTRFPHSWTEKHPWSTGIGFWALAILAIVWGMDVRGIF